MRRRRRERTHSLGSLWLSEAARARARLAAVDGEDLDDADRKLTVEYWRATRDDAAWQLACLRVLPAIRRPVLVAVRDHGPLTTADLSQLHVRFAGRALTADETAYLVADTADAGLLVDCGDGAGAPRWRVSATGCRAADNAWWRRR